MELIDRLDRDRLSVLTGVIVLAMALARFMETPSRPLSTTILGSTAGVNLSAATLAPLLIGGLGITAAESLIRSHPLARSGRISRTAIYWIIPGLISLALASWLISVENLGLWTAGIIVSAILVPVALAAEYLSIGPSVKKRIILQWGQRLLVYLVALILFTRIFDWRARTILSGTAVLFVAAILAARLYWMILADRANTILYGLVAGILLGQLTWVLNYWPLSSLQGGVILLITFYLIVGLTEQFLAGRLTRQVTVEHVSLALIGLLLVAAVVP
ncbi:MAG: hypothetical protein BMS9Abin02_1524 [Anaerolineae bacterium]|nr:MAG: hypothetical protein BMS9Abin02_1524 [Anaerolineae bacterium]